MFMNDLYEIIDVKAKRFDDLKTFVEIVAKPKDGITSYFSRATVNGQETYRWTCRSYYPTFIGERDKQDVFESFDSLNACTNSVFFDFYVALSKIYETMQSCIKRKFKEIVYGEKETECWFDSFDSYALRIEQSCTATDFQGNTKKYRCVIRNTSDKPGLYFFINDENHNTLESRTSLDDAGFDGWLDIYEHTYKDLCSAVKTYNSAHPNKATSVNELFHNM